ncbi:ABC transporter ATP-binding protein [Pseudonocardia sp. HH130630-07]|uniref:ABC transporter ATP-binding protein n=1 Tax=Pseudonocardia sp. HH130630-07 TaxID=1690815 RepID=UPI0008151150|nr:ATP-binding cassette domain-containing protein [Pseudonocardia sp. HH130630-07]ANY07292.1 methionine ABC transporter ATP-binding protein [Pseudonocardia sp. HH130630-07]
MNRPIIETDGLTRTFVRRVREGRRLLRTRVDVPAVVDLDLRIDAGEAVGYIGANGAGKSTTIKMLVGILVPTAGTVRTCGREPVAGRRAVAREVGVVFGQRSQLWWDLPVRDSLSILAAVHRLGPADERSRTAELVETLDLGEFLAAPVRQLSLGQRMRAELAAALMHRPRLVILDEPTIGLDVLSKQRLHEFLIGERARHGTTLLLTTHDMDDVERLCDRVLVLDRGRTLYDGALSGLSRTVRAERVLTVDLERPAADLTGVTDTRHVDSEADGLRQRLAFDPDRTTAARVLAEIGARADVRDLSISEPDITDVVRRIHARERERATG